MPNLLFLRRICKQCHHLENEIFPERETRIRSRHKIYGVHCTGRIGRHRNILPAGIPGCRADCRFDSMNNVMSPFRIDGTNNFNTESFSGRDFFDQLLQTTAVETFWQLERQGSVRPASVNSSFAPAKEAVPGDLRYEFSELTGDGTTGEVINDAEFSNSVFSPTSIPISCKT